MTRICRFMRLDYLSIKPYLTIAFFAAYAFAMTAMSFSDISGAVGMSVIFSAFFVSYPFAVADKANFNALYCQLAISRKEVVKGRYTFLLATSALITIAACVTSLVSSFFRQTADATIPNILPELLPAAAIAILFSGIIQAFQLPIYFRLGYEKARMAAIIPLLAIVGFSSFFMISGPNLNTDQILSNITHWVWNNTFMSIAVALFIWLAIMFASYALSLKFYTQRDF